MARPCLGLDDRGVAQGDQALVARTLGCGDANRRDAVSRGGEALRSWAQAAALAQQTLASPLRWAFSSSQAPSWVSMSSSPAALSAPRPALSCLCSVCRSAAMCRCRSAAAIAGGPWSSATVSLRLAGSLSTLPAEAVEGGSSLQAADRRTQNGQGFGGQQSIVLGSMLSE